jgi:hypothetical protein
VGVSYGYKPMPRNDQQLTVAQVDERIRGILNSNSVYGSYAPRSIPQISLDKRIVENLPLGAEDGTEVFLRVGDGNSVADMLYLASLPGWVQIGQAPIVTTLTGLTAIEGMRVVYDTGTAGVRWDLVYDTSDGTTYPWLYVGGPPLRAYVFTSESTSSTTYVTLTTPVELTIPLAGDYDFGYGAGYFQQSVANTFGYLNVGVNGAPANDNGAAYIYADANEVVSFWQVDRRTGITAGHVARHYYRSMTGGSGTVTANHRTLLATPVRVG